MRHGANFSDHLSLLYERIFSKESKFLDCVEAVVDCLRDVTEWDRVIYSEIRRNPQISELVYVAYGPQCPEKMRIREAPAVNLAVLDAIEELGVVEVPVHSSMPPGTPEILVQAKQHLEPFFSANGIVQGVYAPKRLSPNFTLLLTLHSCRFDRPLAPAEREALMLAQIVLGEITRRKRWRFVIPGRTIEHDLLIPYLAEGWECERIAEKLAWSHEKVQRLSDQIFIELQNQFGLRNEKAAFMFLREEMIKSA